MINGYIKPSQLAILIAGCSLLAGCGGSEESTAAKSANQNTYGYSYLPICIDDNLNGSCESSESLITELNRIPSANENLLIDSNGYFLTANGKSQVISPFTTLIQNEILFNPFVAGDIEQAKQYLQKALGNEIGVDFNKLDSIHGPKIETELLLKSFRHALSLSGDFPYLKISAAVDKMISFKTLDISDKLTQTDLDMRVVNLNNRYFSYSNNPIKALSAPKSLSFNDNTGTLLALISKNKMLQVDLHTGSFIDFSPSDKKPASPSTVNFGHHHDDDLSTLIANLMTLDTSTLASAVQGRSPEQYYLIFQPTSAGDQSISNTCNTGNNGGTNGIFLTHLGNKTKPQSTAIKKSYRIDSFGGASSHKPSLPPIQIQEPEIPASDAKCINNNISGLIPMYEKNQVAVIFTNGDSNHAELQLLDSETLQPKFRSYPLNTKSPQLVISKDQSKLLLIQNNSKNAMMLDTENLRPTLHVTIPNIKNANFVYNDRELLIDNGSNTLQWFSTNATPELLGSLQLDSTVKNIASDPKGKLSAALTSNTLYLIDNQTKEIVTSMGYSKNSIYSVQVLTDKIIIARNGGIDTFQHSQLIGSPIKVGYQILSKEMVSKWGKNSSNQFIPTTLAHILRTNGEDDEISSQFEDVDIEWLPNDANSARDIETVLISGYYRNERISLYKPIKH